MGINLADVTIHIDENLNVEQRGSVEESLRSLDGVVSVSNHEKTPHLTLVTYDSAAMTSQLILDRVVSQGAHAELIGL